MDLPTQEKNDNDTPAADVSETVTATTSKMDATEIPPDVDSSAGASGDAGAATVDVVTSPAADDGDKLSGGDVTADGVTVDDGGVSVSTDADAAIDALTLTDSAAADADDGIDETKEQISDLPKAGGEEEDSKVAEGESNPQGELEQIHKDSKHRVKLYVLNEQRHWDDRGTGHVACLTKKYADTLQAQSDCSKAVSTSSKDVDEDENETTRMSRLVLYVMSEGEGTDGVLLNSTILLDTAYQKQQETLVVWSETDSIDLALSFQDKTGCDEIWERICQVQGKDPSNDVTQDVSYEPESDDADSSVEGTAGTPTTAQGGNSVQLPEVSVTNLKVIWDVFTQCSQSPIKRENLAIAVEFETYIPKLMEVFQKCEKDGDIDSCKLLFQLVRTLLMLNKNALLEIMFRDDLIKDVIGCLEYDPMWSYAYGKEQKRHRDYLWSEATFKEVIPITNTELKNKIHQTYRVQYVQDVILPAPSIFEENLLSALNSYIFFNRVEIVALIQDDEKFLCELFSELRSADTAPAKRRDLALFLKEFCTFAQTLQPQGPQGRDSFFKTLTAHGVLEALERCLSVPTPPLRRAGGGTRAPNAEEGGVGSPAAVCSVAAVEVLAMVVDFSPQLVREYMLAQARPGVTPVNQKDLMINVLITRMFTDEDPELGSAMQLVHVLRLLVDPENMMANSASSKNEKTEFLTFFYKRAMGNLIKPLLDITTGGERPVADDYHTAHKMSLLLEMLSFCIEHHTYHVRNFCVGNDVLKRVLVLLKSKHAFLALGALRLFRRVVQLKDEYYNRHIVRSRSFEPIVKAFQANGHQYNLLNSAMLELFEFIRTEDIKSLLLHFVETYIDEFRDVSYVRTFDTLRQRCEQYREVNTPTGVGGPRRPWTDPDGSPLAVGDNKYGLPSPVWRRDNREPDRDEQEWFNEEDEEWDDELPITPGSAAPPSILTKDKKDTTPPPSDVPSTVAGAAVECSSASPPTSTPVAAVTTTPLPKRHDTPLQPMTQHEMTAGGPAGDIEPDFPSVRRRADDDDDGSSDVFDGGAGGGSRPLVGRGKIVIVRRTVSPSSSPSSAAVEDGSSPPGGVTSSTGDPPVVNAQTTTTVGADGDADTVMAAEEAGGASRGTNAKRQYQEAVELEQTLDGSAKEVSSTTIQPAQSSNAPIIMLDRKGGLVDYELGDSDSEDDDEANNHSSTSRGDAAATVTSTSCDRGSPVKKRLKLDENAALSAGRRTP